MQLRAIGNMIAAQPKEYRPGASCQRLLSATSADKLEPKIICRSPVLWGAVSTYIAPSVGKDADLSPGAEDCNRDCAQQVEEDDCGGARQTRPRFPASTTY